MQKRENSEEKEFLFFLDRKCTNDKPFLLQPLEQQARMCKEINFDLFVDFFSFQFFLLNW